MKMPFTALLLSVLPAFALAQEPLVSRIDRTPPQVMPAIAGPATTSTTPMSSEMWLYLHEEQRHDDPVQAVRRKAEHKADQRMARIDTAKWYGYSNSRPESIMGGYSSGWMSNGYSRYQWMGVSTPYVPYAIVR